MSALRIKTSRNETRRFRVVGDFSGRLLTLDTERPIPLRPVDVSRRGLGFIAKEEMHSGRQLWLEIGAHRLKVEVAYCESHLGIDNLYRCGIFTRDPEVDLETVFGALGLLAEQVHAEGY